VKPPRWIDEEAVFSAEWKLEDEIFDKYCVGRRSELSTEELRRLNAYFALYHEGDWRTEKEAVEEAMRGDPEPLAHLLERYWGLVKPVLPTDRVDQLSVETRRLIVEHVRRGGTKRKRGRPKKDALDRLWETPVHYAAAVVPIIEMILRRMYPNQSSEDIRDRALLFAADRAGTSVETLDNYLKRKRTDRRRLPGV
jgi:hypothetical protein